VSHYLVRFFLNPKTGKQQRHLMLADGSWILGEHIGSSHSINNPTPEFLEKLSSGEYLQSLSDARFGEADFEKNADCVAAFERLAAKAVADGFFLTDLVDRMQDTIPADARPKPNWQQDLDRAYLRSIARDHSQPAPAAALTAKEPLALLIEARYQHVRKGGGAVAALAIAETARAEIDRRNAAKQPFYTWSIHAHEIEASVYELMFHFNEELKNKDAMFAAIRRAVDLGLNNPRGEYLAWVQCYHFPALREDAFEYAFRYAEFGYDSIKKHPDFAAYAVRRKKEVASGHPRTRWHKMQEPSTLDAITKTEAAMGVTFPADYRAFLQQRGKTKLSFLLRDETKDLSFADAADFHLWQTTFQDWLDLMGATHAGITDSWPEKYGVDRRQLYSVATPWDNSSCLVIGLGPGKSYGRCFLWDHDEADELVSIGASFDAALKAIENGFLAGSPEINAFFGIYPEDPGHKP
jgi:cell wall assembly regulator SMI1